MWVTNYDGHAFFDMNIVTGTKGFPDKAFLRALEGDVFRLHGEDYPLRPLRDAVDILHSRLRRRIPRCSRTSRLERTGQSFTKVGAII